MDMKKIKNLLRFYFIRIGITDVKDGTDALWN